MCFCWKKKNLYQDKRFVISISHVTYHNPITSNLFVIRRDLFSEVTWRDCVKLSYGIQFAQVLFILKIAHNIGVIHFILCYIFITKCNNNRM